MAIYRRFIVQQKYVDGQPTEEFRLGMEVDGKNYHSQEACESGSECTQVEYRWTTVEDDYICEGTSKYTKQKRQQKCVTDDEWTDIYPYEYQKGDMIEKDSEDCGYEVDYYRVYPMTDGGGKITIVPSLASYRENTEIGVMQEENRFYTLSYYEYGSTAEYGSSTTSKTFTLPMTNDWYISAHYTYSEPEPVTEGNLYYSYTDGTEITLIHSASTLSKSLYNGSNAVIIRDLSGVITSIPKSAFKYASLVEIDLPVCKYLSQEAFYEADLEKIGIPLCSYIGTSAIQYTQLTELYLPNCLSIGQYAIENNSRLENISLQKCKYISYQGMWGNKALKEIVLPEVSVIEGYAFGQCINLSDITLGYSSVVSFNYSTTFRLCHSGLRIYVPESLCDIYMSKYGSYSVLLSGSNYVYYSDIFYCGGYVSRYSVTLASNSDGSISIRPSQPYYNEGSYVTLTATPNEDRSFVRFLYGSTPEYGSVATSSPFQLSVMNDLYFSAEYEDITPYYKIYPMTDGYGTLKIEPSQSSYRKGTSVAITDTPSVNYVFSWFKYGSTNAYGSTTTYSTLSLTMTNDWYVSAVHSYVKPDYEGYIICGYTDGTSKSYYWNKSTLSNADFSGTLGGNSVTWLTNLDGCVKSVALGGYDFSWISLNGLETCDYANFYDCSKLTDIYLYGNKIVDFTSANFYTNTESGPFFLYSAPTSLMIHVDCNNYGRYEQLYSSVSRPKLILYNHDAGQYQYEYFIDHITCESVSPIISYTINVSEVEGGNTFVLPSKDLYKPYDEVVIHVLNSYNYSFKQLNFGETSACSLTTQSSYMKTMMINDLYLKPEFNRSDGERANGLLYYSYSNSSELWIPWSLPYLTKKYTEFNIISCIDYGQTIVKISYAAFYRPDWDYYSGGSASFPVCREIGRDAFYHWVGLESIDAKQVEVIQDGGLNSCSYLIGLDFPNLVAVSSSAFEGTDRITFVNMPNLKYCTGFFTGNINYSQTLESMTLPNLLYLDRDRSTTGVFFRRTNLQHFNAPNCKVFNGGTDALNGTSITSLYLPNCCLFNCGVMGTLNSLTLSDKFFMFNDRDDLSYYSKHYSSLITISDANIGLFPEGWNNTKLTNGTCNVYGILNHSFADESVIKNIDYINMDNCFYIGHGALSYASMISEIILKDCQWVGEKAFGKTTQLTKVDLRNAYVLYKSIFIDASKLTDVNVDNVIILEDDAFNNCGMSVLSLPNAVWLRYGVRYCKNLKDIYLNSSIKTDFDSLCFDGCNSELKIHVPSSQYSRYVNEDGFNVVNLYNDYDSTYSSFYLRDLFTSNNVRPEIIKSIFIDYYGLEIKSFVIPSMSILDSTMYGCSSAWAIDDKHGLITTIPYGAFGYKTKLHEINLPGCQTIEESAFYSMSRLQDVNISNVEYIGNNAFYSCSNISSTLSLNACSIIGDRAFYGCTGLRSVYLMSNSVVNFDASTTFAYCTYIYSLSIYVPHNLYDDYISKYGSISVSVSTTKASRYYRNIITSI